MRRLRLPSAVLDGGGRGAERALIPKVDQGMVWALRDAGINSINELLNGMDEAALGAFKRPGGTQIRKIGDAAAIDILRSAPPSERTL